MDDQGENAEVTSYELELVRDTYSRDMGTFGVLSLFSVGARVAVVSHDGEVDMRAPYPGEIFPASQVESVANFPPIREKLFECHTVERPWANNAPNISCIPEGRYPLRPRRFYRGGYDTWEVCDVPGRSLILIHRGNTAGDVQGCIAVGTYRGVVDHLWAVMNSEPALAELLEHLARCATVGPPVEMVISQLLATTQNGRLG